MKFRHFLKSFYKSKKSVIPVLALMIFSLIAITSVSAAVYFGSFKIADTTYNDPDTTAASTEMTAQVSETQVVSSEVSESSVDSSAIQAVALDALEEANAPPLEESSAPPLEVSSAPPLEVFPEGVKVCYLTFDDGPSSNSTPQILEILSRYNAKATFFVVGYGRLDYLQTIIQQGHTIGLHTDSHVYANIYSSDEAYYADLEAVSNKVFDATGVRSKIIRFPGGSSNRSSLTLGKCPGIMTRLTVDVEAKGYRYFDWNVSTGDADQTLAPVETILENVRRQSNGKSQICVLMHDTNAKTTSVEALPAVIEYLASQGFEFRALTMDSPVFHHERLNN